MNPVLAFVIGLFVGAVFVTFIIGLFVVEEDESEKWSKRMFMVFDAIEEIQREERYKMKEEWERASAAERNFRLDDIDRQSDALFRAYYENYIKQGYDNGK